MFYNRFSFVNSSLIQKDLISQHDFSLEKNSNTAVEINCIVLVFSFESSTFNPSSFLPFIAYLFEILSYQKASVIECRYKKNSTSKVGELLLKVSIRGSYAYIFLERVSYFIIVKNHQVKIQQSKVIKYTFFDLSNFFFLGDPILDDFVNLGSVVRANAFVYYSSIHVSKVNLDNYIRSFQIYSILLT
ncbi:hypothetical protein AB834_01625 [PVC group bacterium (ex Bugula neritina AB1)]|nr:hypothetical protein AB834_01625 [PVC group bacterium (ex Bugula neritina AB1)]